MSGTERRPAWAGPPWPGSPPAAAASFSPPGPVRRGLSWGWSGRRVSSAAGSEGSSPDDRGVPASTVSSSRAGSRCPAPGAATAPTGCPDGGGGPQVGDHGGIVGEVRPGRQGPLAGAGQRSGTAEAAQHVRRQGLGRAGSPRLGGPCSSGSSFILCGQVRPARVHGEKPEPGGAGRQHLVAAVSARSRHPGRVRDTARPRGGSGRDRGRSRRSVLAPTGGAAATCLWNPGGRGCGLAAVVDRDDGMKRARLLSSSSIVEQLAHHGARPLLEDVEPGSTKRRGTRPRFSGKRGRRAVVTAVRKPNGHAAAAFLLVRRGRCNRLTLSLVPSWRSTFLAERFGRTMKCPREGCSRTGRSAGPARAPRPRAVPRHQHARGRGDLLLRSARGSLGGNLC